jgi:hypothetical protein
VLWCLLCCLILLNESRLVEKISADELSNFSSLMPPYWIPALCLITSLVRVIRHSFWHLVHMLSLLSNISIWIFRVRFTLVQMLCRLSCHFDICDIRQDCSCNRRSDMKRPKYLSPAFQLLSCVITSISLFTQTAFYLRLAQIIIFLNCMFSWHEGLYELHGLNTLRFFSHETSPLVLRILTLVCNI